MRTQKNKVRFMVTGLLLSLMILFSQFFFCFQQDSPEQKKSPARQEKGAPQTKIYASATVYSLPSPQVAVITQDFSFIREILFDLKENEVAATTDIASSWRKFLCTLFRVIISSNAP